jgi:cob(I)alamin adenosyltransferase
VEESLGQVLIKIQRDLFKVGAEIASLQIVIPAKAGIQGEQAKRLDPRLHGDDRIGEKEIIELENNIDKMWGELPELKNFIIPGGSEASAHLHLARAICRRAERALVAFGKTVPLRPELYQYLNRLSDWLFTAARWVNFKTGEPENLVLN